MRLALVIVIVVVLSLTFAGAAQAAPDGSALFARNCAICHQADASGTIGLAPPIKGEQWARLGADRGYLPAVLVHGLSGAIQVAGQTYTGSMPPFAAQLDDESLAAIATHLRGLQGAGDSYSAEDMAAERSKPGSPPQTRALRKRLLGN